MESNKENKLPERSSDEKGHLDFESRVFNIISKTVEQENLSEEELEKIKAFQSSFPGMFSPEVENYLLSLKDDELLIIVSKAFRDINSETDIEVVRKYYSEVTVDNIKNRLLYQQVYGYDHPDLEKREKENPIPTAAELMLGCYIEQIEEQTRNAVMVLRSKGYDTVQSGFYDKDKGSQFFDIYEDVPTEVPDNLIKEMEDTYGVLVTTDRSEKLNRTDIILTPKEYKDIKEWQEALDYFATAMPIKAKENFGAYGMGVSFAFNTIKKYPIESILATAANDHQKELIEKLFECKTKEDIIHLFNTEPDTAEQMIIQDNLKSDVGDLKEIQSTFNLYSHVSNRESIAEGLDLMKREFSLLSEKYKDAEDKQDYLTTIQRGIDYLQGHLDNAKS